MVSKMVRCPLKSDTQREGGRACGWFRAVPTALCWRGELAREGPGKAGHSVCASRDCRGEGSKISGNRDVTPAGHARKMICAAEFRVNKEKKIIIKR